MKLYDYVFNIINKDKPYEDLSAIQKGDYNQFMINKVLSMDYDLLKVSQLNNNLVNKIPDKIFDNAMQQVIPSKRYNLTYKKGKSKGTADQQVIEKISKLYSIPNRDAEMYYKDMSEEQINEVLEIFGIENE